ncbi:TetR/AcrR family transcriptional regulator [Nocardia nova]|uniref:TetR/AcrR family transcriptional regulator n=1 Tax=Nocardia nova TaxID=37330 RepID=UPI0033D1AF2F
MTDPTDRRTELADAAIETLAAAGLRGLTHRAVDRTAGLPEGSCSNVFRTRQALIAAAVERLAEADTSELATLPAFDDADLDTVAAAVTDVLRRWTTTGRTRMLARYELCLESTRQPDLRGTLIAAGAGARAVARDLLTNLAHPESIAGRLGPDVAGEMFVTFLDGLIFGHLTGTSTLTGDRIAAATTGFLRATTAAPA